MPLSRRQLLTTAGVAAAPFALSACGGFSTSSPDEATGASSSDTIAFTTWGTDAELAGFKAAIDSFQQANQGVTVRLNAVPYEQMFTTIDAQLQAGNPPDVFRVPYYTFGSYAGRGQLLDLSTYLESDVKDRFTPQAWAAVQNARKPFGVPHHTDTSVIFYRAEPLQAAGIQVPTSIEEAWTWEEFVAAGTELKGRLGDDKWPFAYNWQGNGVTRWLNILFQADGRFLEDDLLTPAIDSEQGRLAVQYSQNFFRQNLVPQNNSVKSSTYAADTWYAGTTAMTFGGAFLIPDATDTLKDEEWGVTFPPKKVRSGGDFGGNALVATKNAKNPELVARFLTHVTEKQQMADFCAAASLLPTRADLVQEGIDFEVRPELSPVFVGQAGAVLPQDSGQVASPSMSAIITVLKDQLEEAFVGDQDVETTLKNLSDGIGAAVKR